MPGGGRPGHALRLDEERLEAAAAAAGKLTVFQTDGAFLTSPYHVLTAILGGAVLSMASHGTDYIIVQRLFSTESLRDSRRALVTSGVVVILQFALFLSVGTLLFLFYGALPLNGDAVFPKFIVEQVPTGLSGHIIAGFLAAAMSTISGSISSISSSTVFDLWASTRRGREASEETKLKLSRRVSFGWAVLLTGAALVFIGTGRAVVELALSIASFTYGGFLGLFLSFSFAACGALRLARFNVLAQRGDKGSSRFFVGLPIPLAAGTITALVIAHYKEFGAATDAATRLPVLAVVALLSFLMVSTVRYRTFKDLHLSARSLGAFAVLCAAGIAVGAATRASFVLVVYMGAYIAGGIAESVFEKARTLDRSRLPPAVRAELDADEALEPGPEDVDGDKVEEDEYI